MRLEGKLVELKAKVENLDPFRKRLKELNAQYIGAFHQIDTYFEVPKGRLKLREIKGGEEAELIYYEREDTSKPKRSEVFILKIQKPKAFKALFEKVLKKKVVVEKIREIYHYKGTQIHLDIVNGLGTFIEFERKTKGSPESTSEDREVLLELMGKIGIKDKNLIRGSYSDLKLTKTTGNPHLSYL